jgi:hypothetical protein
LQRSKRQVVRVDCLFICNSPTSENGRRETSFVDADACCGPGKSCGDQLLGVNRGRLEHDGSGSWDSSCENGDLRYKDGVYIHSRHGPVVGERS